MDPSSDISDLKHQIKHAKVAKQYKQAQALEDELHRLKQVQEDRQMQDLLHLQARELLACDNEYEHDVQQLIEVWSGNLSELHHQLLQNEQQMLSRHAEETATLLATQAAYPARPKFSPALLNMRHIERTLAEQKEFDKADQVRKQADELEQMELSQMGSDRAARIEVEQARLATQQSREVEATAKKTNSAVLAAQQRQEYEVEQLMRRFQAVKLALTRAHATQRISLQQSLRGSLGLKKPSKLLGLPSLNSSLTETRGLVPEPAQKLASRQPSAGPISPTIRAAGGSRCNSPVQELNRISGTYSPMGSGRCGSPLGSPDRSATASPTGGNKRASVALCNPERAMHYDPYEHGSPAVSVGLAVNGLWDPSPVITQRKTIAAADAAAAAAGLGLSMPSLIAGATRAAVGSAKARKPADKPSNDTRAYTGMNSGTLMAHTSVSTAAAANFPSCRSTGRPETRAAAGQPSPPKRPAAGQGALAFAPAGITNSKGAGGTAGIGALRPTTRHGPVGTAAPTASIVHVDSNGSIHSNSSGFEPWASTPGALLQQHSAEGRHTHSGLNHPAPSHVSADSKGAGAASATGIMNSTVISHVQSGKDQDCCHTTSGASIQLGLHEQGSGQGLHGSYAASVDAASAMVASLLSTAAVGCAHTAATAVGDYAAALCSNGTCDHEQEPSEQAGEAAQGPAAAVSGEPKEARCSEKNFGHLEAEPEPCVTAAGPVTQLPSESSGAHQTIQPLKSTGEQVIHGDVQQAGDSITAQPGVGAIAGPELTKEDVQLRPEADETRVTELPGCPVDGGSHNHRDHDGL